MGILFLFFAIIIYYICVDLYLQLYVLFINLYTIVWKNKEEFKMSLKQKKNSTNKKGSFQKPVYKKKPKVVKPRTKPISTEEHMQKENDFHPVFMNPSEKYIETIKGIFKKGYFVDAQYGNRVFTNNILEYHIDRKKDIPVLLCEVKYKNKQGDICSAKKVFRVVRFNENEIIGMNSTNINIWMMATANVQDILPKEVKKVNRKKE